MTPVHAVGKVGVRLEARIQARWREVELPRSFDFFMLPATDAGGDKDGDGLTNYQEMMGWDIKVDIFGFGLDPGQLGTFLQHHVDSDPSNPDTDGDGLPDGNEFIAKANPRAVDTDGDGLWDGEERFRWLTSPVSIDSDGDARSPDISSERSTLPPNPSLFDGTELYDDDELLKAPADRGEIKLLATSPTLDDTDGDNVRDTDEIDTPVRTPLLADMPQLLFEIVDEVDIRLDVEYAEEEGRTTAFETSFTKSESTENSTSNTVSASVTVGTEVEFGITGGVSASVEVTAGWEESWGTKATTGSEQTSTQLEENSRNLTETAATGSMIAGIKVSNIGNISVQVVDLGWTARQWQPNLNTDPLDTSPGDYSTFASLGVDLGSGVTLAPGADSGVLAAIADDINADRVKAFLAKPDSLQLEPAAFELINDEGINFAFIEEITRARTARVSIDFGDGTFEEYRIATNVDRNADSTLAGIKMSKVMDLTVGVGNWETQSAIPPCGGPEADLATNGGFESPDLSGGEPALPADWDFRTIGRDPSEGTALVVEGGTFGTPAAVEGDQWLLMTPAVFDDIAINQQIGVVIDNTDHDYSFTGGRLGYRLYYSISIWAGDPSAGGVLLDGDDLELDSESPIQVTGTLNSGTGSAGADLYVEILLLAVGAMRGDGPALFIDGWEITGPTPVEALWRVRDVSSDMQVPRFWMVFLSEGLSLDATRFEDIVLRNGESILIALTQDSDGDGLYSAQEQQYGSSDDIADTDGDGVSDPIESARQYIDHDTCEILEGGWLVVITPASGGTDEFRAYSNPLVEDSDGDGLSDNAERLGADGLPPDDPNDAADATNPLSRDSDGDGLTDDEDPFPTIEAITFYVDADASGANNGLSWDDAYTSLGTAMDEADDRNSDTDGSNDVGEIWVASGSYGLSIQPLPRSTKIYGGFAGNETRLGQRVADGMINGTYITGAGPMITLLPVPISARLDGFTLQNSTDAPAIWFQNGQQSNIEIANCFFFNNVAFAIPGLWTGGAAISASFTNLTIEDCIFSDNIVGGGLAPIAGGGAVYVSIGSQLIIRRCTFVRNLVTPTLPGTQSFGGALYVLGTFTLIEDSRFLNNSLLELAEAVGDSAVLNGGAISLVIAPATVRNTTFEGNEVDHNENTLGKAWKNTRAGGGVATYGASVNFVNCLFRGNRASMFGGGLFVASGTAKVVNCTFHGNEAYPDLKSDDEIKPDRGCSGGDLTRPIAVGGGIGASGTVIVDNTVFWDNVGTEWVTRKITFFQELPVFALDFEQQICTQPGPFHTGSGVCIDSGGSITYNNCAIEIKEVVWDDRSSDGGADFAGMLEGSGNIFPTDVGFANATGGNLRLSASSVLIDAGNQYVDADIILAGFQLLPDFDLDDNARITDGDGDGTEEIDIGAYEYQAD